LKQQVSGLKDRLVSLEQANADLTALRTQALSRLAAQHEEITRLRAVVAGGTNVLALPSARDRAARQL
jgi:hypothetical protein